MKTIVILLAALTIFDSKAENLSFNWLNNASGENSALSGKCNSNHSGKDLICNFRQIKVRKKLTPEDMKVKINSIREDLDKLIEEKSIAEAVETEFANVCSEVTSISEYQSNPHYHKVLDMCNAPTKQKVINVLSLSTIQDSKTCRVVELDAGEFSFEQVNDNKWVSTNKPTGQCGVVTVLTIERDLGYLWKYSQIRHYTNTASEICKQLSSVNEEVIYSSRAINNLKVDCEYIEFGI